MKPLWGLKGRGAESILLSSRGWTHREVRLFSCGDGEEKLFPDLRADLSSSPWPCPHAPHHASAVLGVGWRRGGTGTTRSRKAARCDRSTWESTSTSSPARVRADSRGGPQKAGGAGQLLCGPRPPPASVYRPALAVYSRLGTLPRQISRLTKKGKAGAWPLSPTARTAGRQAVGMGVGAPRVYQAGIALPRQGGF